MWSCAPLPPPRAAVLTELFELISAQSRASRPPPQPPLAAVSAFSASAAAPLALSEEAAPSTAVSGRKRKRPEAEDAPAATADADDAAAVGEEDAPAPDARSSGASMKRRIMTALGAAAGRIKGKKLRAALVQAAVPADFTDAASANAAVDATLRKLEARGKVRTDGKYIAACG